MSKDPSAPRRDVVWRDRILRPLLVAFCVVASGIALADMARWRLNRSELEALLSPADTEDRLAALRRVTFERTSHHAQLIVARTLVSEAMALTEEPNDSESGVAQLTEARRLALEVLHEQPNNWQASMLLGAATYLDWSMRSDRRLYTEASSWEEPLIKAIREAEGKLEPRRFLVTAYLETWSALSEGKRAFAMDLLEVSFRDDTIAFARLAPTWLEVAGERALEVMPDRPAVWQILERTFAASADWEAFRDARLRYFDALRAELEEDLDEAAERLRLGDLGRGRAMCLGVVVAAPRNGRFVDLVNRALELYPPGLHGLRSTETLMAWLNWSLELSAISIDPFSPRALSRLTDAIGELDPPIGAMAALVAGDTYRTSRFERLEESKRRKAWAPFLIAKAHRLVDGDAVGSDDLDAASLALLKVNRSAEETVPYWISRLRVARARGDLVGLATAEERLDGFRKREWAPLEWRWRGARATLLLYPDVPARVPGRGGSGSRPAQGVASGGGIPAREVFADSTTSDPATSDPELSGSLSAIEPVKVRIEINEAPARGSVLGLTWDGTLRDVVVATAGAWIDLEVELEPGPHLLELRALAGGEVFPGRVRLE